MCVVAESAKRNISGTWGEVWLDGDKAAEVYGFQAKISYNKTDVQMCGTMAVDAKVTSYKGTGSVRFHKINSRMLNLIGDKIRDGIDVRFTIISKLADPDAYGAERVVVRNVSFDDLTLADWEAGNIGQLECPFTFTDYDFLDTIG